MGTDFSERSTWEKKTKKAITTPDCDDFSKLFKVLHDILSRRLHIYLERNAAKADAPEKRTHPVRMMRGLPESSDRTRINATDISHS